MLRMSRLLCAGIGSGRSELWRFGTGRFVIIRVADGRDLTLVIHEYVY